MSCIFNTMSERAGHHFEEAQEKELVETAKASSIIEGFDQHGCSTVLKKCTPILAKSSVQKLLAKLIIDRGSIFDKYSDQEQFSASVELEDKVLQTLIIMQVLCIKANHMLSLHGQVNLSYFCLLMYCLVLAVNLSFGPFSARHHRRRATASTSGCPFSL